MSSSPPNQPARRERGGKRARRGQRSIAREQQLRAALEALDAAKNEFAAEYDPDGVWGLSDHGFELVEQARLILDQVSHQATHRDVIADGALSRLMDFLLEYDGWRYATERAEGFFDEASDILRR